jgi:hypothetical protein
MSAKLARALARRAKASPSQVNGREAYVASG